MTESLSFACKFCPGRLLGTREGMVGRLDMEKGKEVLEQNSSEKKKGSVSYRWLIWGFCITLFFSLAFTALYGNFRTYVENYNISPVETENNLLWIYQSNYLLYRDLYNKVNETDVSYLELYLQPKEGYEWIWDENLSEEAEYFSDMFTESANDIDENVMASFIRYQNGFKEYFRDLESCFGGLNANYDYYVEDLKTGKIISNFDYTDFSLDKQYFAISFIFDEVGNVAIDNEINGSDISQIRKIANEIIRNNELGNMIQKYNPENISYFSFFNLIKPKNCKITYCVSLDSWEKSMSEEYSLLYNQNDIVVTSVYFDRFDYSLFVESGAANIIAIMILIIGLLALFAPCIGEMPEEKLPWNHIALPFEVLATVGLLILSLVSEVLSMAADVCLGNYMRSLTENGFMIYGTALLLTYCLNIIVLWIYFFSIWYLGIQLRALRILGLKKYIKRRCLLYRIFPFIKGKCLKMYDAIAHFDVTKNAHKLILKIVLVNAVVLFIISSLWFGGFAITVVYSVLLYFVLRKYISDLQKKYSILLKATNEMAEGNLNVAIIEDLGVFEPFKPQIFRIQRGFRKAVENETKSQRMKAELITNVSHDLKTPLTAIITYIGLMKEENITEEQRREYLGILERKSHRLKVLIEDLFEVSKANSHSISLHITDVDIMNLIKQVAFEMSDKLTEANLDLRMNLTEEKIILSLDSQKTYRVYENLFGNIAKHGLGGTRVYVNGFRIDDRVVITLKNITAEEIQVKPEELTDRFVRGDVSRNTEGSGLGLAIAKSFLELQGGNITIDLDGDLFKVTTTFTLKKQG